MWQNALENILNSPIFEKIKSIFAALMDVFMPLLHPYVDELKDFQFRIANPLFWVCFLTAVFFLNCFWRFKKAFLFCLMVSVILLLTTALENSMAGVLFSESALFNYMALRYVSLFVISCVSVYFLFIKLD